MAQDATGAQREVACIARVESDSQAAVVSGVTQRLHAGMLLQTVQEQGVQTRPYVLQNPARASAHALTICAQHFR